MHLHPTDNNLPDKGDKVREREGGMGSRKRKDVFCNQIRREAMLIHKYISVMPWSVEWPGSSAKPCMRPALFNDSSYELRELLLPQCRGKRIRDAAEI